MRLFLLLVVLLAGCDDDAAAPPVAARAIVVGTERGDFVGPGEPGAARDSAAAALAIVLDHEPAPPRVVALPKATPLVLTALAESSGEVAALGLIDPPGDGLPAALAGRVAGEVTIARTFRVTPETALEPPPAGRIERLGDVGRAVLAEPLAEGRPLPDVLDEAPVLWRLTKIAHAPDDADAPPTWLRVEWPRGEADTAEGDGWPAAITLRPGEAVKLTPHERRRFRPDAALPSALIRLADEAQPPVEVRPEGAAYTLRLAWQKLRGSGGGNGGG